MTPDVHDEADLNEVSLMDIVHVLQKRKIAVGAVFLACVLVGVTLTALTTPLYTSKADVVPLEHTSIIQSWLESRHAGELVAADLGDRLLPSIFPGRWDAANGRWNGEPPSAEEAGAAVKSYVTIDPSKKGTLTVSVTMPDPLLARDVADSYVRTLDQLRPHLENITRQASFDKYYDGENELQAQSRAEVTARQMNYWLVLDDANVPGGPVSPRPLLNVTLAAVLGIVLGVFAAFVLEWFGNYRAGGRPVDVPAEPTPEERRPLNQPATRRRFE